MDAKDLRTEAALGDRSNDGNSKYSQASVLQANRNKTYHDIGSNLLANKVEAQAARPCAVIGPDRVVPPPAPVDAYLKKASIEPWPGPDTAYRRPPEYPHKLPDYNLPSRNISPRQTFQENMQRFMLPPSYNNTTKVKEDHNFPVDVNNSPQRSKLSGSTEAKYCEVPYTISPLASEQKNISVSNNNAAFSKSAHGWLPSSNIRPTKPYSAEVYQYPEYQNCAGPRPVLMSRPHGTALEESGHIYNETYYHDASLRYKPYPAVKERFPQARYEYVGNYSNPFHPPPPFPSHKYDVQKQLPPHPYSSYPQVPLKYMDTRLTNPAMNSYQRPINPHVNFNSLAYRNQMIHPQYGPVPGNGLQPNKFYPYPPDKSITVSKPPYDPTTHKSFGEYESMRAKPYPMAETYYVNEMIRHHPIKAAQVMPPNYPTIGMHGMPPHPYYRKENPTMMNYETNPHYRNIDPSINMSGSVLSRLPTQFSPNAIAISPSESNTSNDTTHTLGTSQEDFGYVSQSSSASIRSVDTGLNRMQGDFYRRYDYRYGSMVKSIPSKSNVNSDSNLESKNKKNIDLRQYLQMWNEGEDENGDSNKEITVSSSCNTHEIVNHSGNTNQEQLYVLGLVNVPSEELSKYEHIQKISKLPENIKGYNSIELLNQFEEVIESSNLNNYSSKPPTPRSFQISSLKSSSMQSIGIPSRPLSPLDVEAKISQSVIHKEVGCNFEIKPCSPKIMNVEVATSIQNVLSERVIEKVNNPVLVPTPILNRVNDNVGDCEIIKHQDHRIILNDNKASSCKMVSSQYPSSENSSSAKSNYSLQDLESNSGVCLASLPRLDNDIELTFPEVNQQFINANKVESVIAQNTNQKDLPALDIDNSEDLQEMEFKKLLPEGEHEKEFPKLSQYRKRRKRNSDSKEDNEINVQSIRTNSVIIKNPENIKGPEKVTDNIVNNNAHDGQQDPINLTVYSDPRGDHSNFSGNENTTDTSQNMTIIDYNSNPNTEIDNKVCFVDNNQNLRKEECYSEENIIEKSLEVENTENPKSKNSNNCISETSVINKHKVDTKDDADKPVSPTEEFRKVDCDESDRKKVVSYENDFKNEQNILKETSYPDESSLEASKTQSKISVCHEITEYDPNVKLNFNDLKVSFALVTDEHKHETSPKTNEESTDQQLSINNMSSLDSKVLKIGEEHKHLILPKITSSSDQNSEIKSVEVFKQQCDIIPEKSFRSVLGQTQDNKEHVLYTKIHKELYSPTMQNLILCVEGNHENPLKASDSDTDVQQENAKREWEKSCESIFPQQLQIGRLENHVQQESIENKLEKSCVHKSPKQCEVGCFENHGNCDGNLKTTEISQIECLDEDPKVKSVYWNTLSDQEMPATSKQHTLKCDPIVNDDYSETFSTSSTTYSDTCNAQSNLTVNFEEKSYVSSSHTLKDISEDLNPTELLSTDTENSKEITTVEFDISKTVSDIKSPCTNNEYKDLSKESSEKTDFDSSVEGSEFKPSVPEDQCVGNLDIKTYNVLNKDEINEKESILIQTDDCSPRDILEIEGGQEFENYALSDSKDSLQLQCKSLQYLDTIGDTEHCLPEKSNFCVESINYTDSIILKDKENQVGMSEKLDHEALKLIENEKSKDNYSIDLSYEKIDQLDNGHDSISNNSTNLKDLDTDSSSSKHTNNCNDFVVPQEKVNSNKSVHENSEMFQSIDHINKSCEKIDQLDNVHDSSSNNSTNLKNLDTDSSSSKCTNICSDFVVPQKKVNSNKSVHDNSQMFQSIDHINKSCEETVEILQELYPDVPKTGELTWNELANRDSTKLNFLSVNNCCLKNKSLKRSLSDSAINMYNQEDQNNTLSLNKRKKIGERETLEPQIITENYCSIVQNNRRNSMSSIHNEGNVSFCILIDNNCILTEDCEGSDKFCYTEIPEHCLSCIESDGDNEIVEEGTDLISIQGEVNYDHCENLELNEDSSVVNEQDLQETWVEDIGCIETVVSDEVAEDIVVTESMSPKDTDMSDDDSDIFNINEHTDKVKYIYGDKMCTNDAHLVETLYRTPQMDVNKTLVNRESQGIDDCHRYYDEESLEKLLSESTNFHDETGCSLSTLSPPNPSFPNRDTGLTENLSFSLLKNNKELTHFEHNTLKAQIDTVHSYETSNDDVFTFIEENPKCTTSSSPEVSSTTSEERNSGILLKITNFGGARVAQVNSFDADKNVTNVSCKYTENKDYAKSHNNSLPNRPLITKAAQKYIPPLKETIPDLKIKLQLPQHSLLKLKELKMSKEEPKLTSSINKHNSSNCITKEIPKKTKPKFEDVLKSIDELEYKMHKEKSKKSKKFIPKVVIKKNENGSHYTSTSNKDKYNPDLTGRKWQPWVFIEKNHFIDKMALKKKTKAIFSHRKNTFILAETFKKYKSITNAKFVITQPISESSTGQLKYTIRLKHNY